MNRVILSQGSPEWLEWRQLGLGGSDIAAVLGISPYEDGTRDNVFAEKVHGWERPQNGGMYRGKVMEPHARAAYMDRFRCQAPPVCVVHPELPWARVSLDGLCDNGARVRLTLEEWILELKCPKWETHDLALNGIVPDYFEVQCQWQMFCCRLERCDFASFNPSAKFTPGNALSWDEWRKASTEKRPPRPEEWLAVVPLKADRERQEWILGEAAQFWFEVEGARAAFDREARKR